MILIRAGLYSNSIRFLPPLVITDEHLGEALAVIEAGIAEVLWVFRAPAADI